MKVKETEKKIPSTTGLLTKTDFDVKITEIENKIRDINGLITSYEFNRLAKVVFDENLKNVTKTLPLKGI